MSGGRRHRFRAGFVFVALIVALLVTASLADRDARPTAATPAASAEPAAAAATPPAGRPPAPSPPAPSLPLPELDAPLGDIAADLLRRADAGESAAACRLGVELLRCRDLLFWRSESGVFNHGLTHAAYLEEGGRHAEAEAALEIGELEAQRIAQCQRLDPELIARGPLLLRAAALAGEREALLRYVDGRVLFRHMQFDFIASAAFDQWRREAPALLQRALAAGHPDVVLLLAGGHGGGDGPIQGLLPDDALQAEAARQVAARLFGAEADALLEPLMRAPAAGLDAAQRAEAGRLAARWHEMHYGGATFEPEALIDLRLTAALAANGDLIGPAPAGGHCGDGPGGGR